MKIECRPATCRSMLTIFIDEEPWRDIHASLFGHRPLLPKECPSIAAFAEEFAAIEYRHARQYALKRLSLMSLPSTKLLRDFHRFHISPDISARLLEELTRMGYLNDQEWIIHFAKGQKEKKVGPKAIALKLMSKGLKSEQIETTLRNFQTENDQKKAISQLLLTRYKTRDLTNFCEKQKVIGALVRRGFDIEVVLDTLGRREE